MKFNQLLSRHCIRQGKFDIGLPAYISSLLKDKSVLEILHMYKNKMREVECAVVRGPYVLA